jgi:cell division protein ZapB
MQQTEMFALLERKIEEMLEEVELLRMEVTELRDAKDALEAEKSESTCRLQSLLARFETTQPDQQSAA